MSWLHEVLNEAGLGSLVAIHKNSPDKKPDDLDIKKVVSDYLDERKSIDRSSDDFKKVLNENSIVVNKKAMKSLNDKMNLGFTNSELEKMTYEQLVEKGVEKVNLEKEGLQKSGTKEIQKQLDDKILELNKLKTDNELKFTEYEGKITEATNQYEAKLKADKIQGIVDKAFSDPKRKWTNADNDKIIVNALMKDRGITVNEEGKVFKGEKDLVLAPDGKTVLKDVDMLLDSIATERQLIQKSAGPDKPDPTKIIPNGKHATLSPEQKIELDRQMRMVEKPLQELLKD